MTVTTYDAVTPRDLIDGWAPQVAAVAELADYIAATDFVPRAYRGNAAAVAAAILAGRELGIGPMTALQHLHVVDGRPAMSAQLMRSLVLAAGHEIRIVENTNTRCLLHGRRKGDHSETPALWTLDDARTAGLLGRGAWKTYPRAMLLARATVELCRAVFPDVIGGMAYTVEEATDAPAEGVVENHQPTGTRTVQRSRGGRAPHPTDSASEAPAALPPPLPEGPLIVVSPDVPVTDLRETPPVEPENAPTAPDADEGDQSTAPTWAERYKPANAKQLAAVFAILGDLHRMEPRAARLHTVSGLVGRRLDTMSQLTRSEAGALIDTLVYVQEFPEERRDVELDVLVHTGWAAIGNGAKDEPEEDETPWTEPPLPPFSDSEEAP